MISVYHVFYIVMLNQAISCWTMITMLIFMVLDWPDFLVHPKPMLQLVWLEPLGMLL
ncbi:hypothetical protein GIB67_030842 [Kingdonia uniflora]|uniref:Uncharacterized protein n=1 Tax=Kingdonia uniflora TaxID=39325 RepID=A0A7J7L3E3_9MAGN|nr:hypothetical protein GIB67_030842 [Kingdonia uniflora]